MIPLAAIPWRLIGIGAAVVAVALMGWRVSVWHGSHKALKVAEKALKAERACDKGTECARRVAELEARQEQATAEAVKGYEQELADLRNRPVPRRVIRVCPAGGPVRDAADPGGTATAPGTGLVHETDEFDTGPLRELARQADELAAAYRALRARDEALADAE